MGLISADPRLLGALRKTVAGGGWGGWGGGGGGLGWKNGWNAFIRVSLRLRLEKQYLFRGLVHFQLVFLVSSKRLYDIHVTWFDWFLRREGDSAPH